MFCGVVIFSFLSVFVRLVQPLVAPSPCEIDIEFFLYDYNTGPEEPEELEIGSTDDVPIDGTIPFKFLIHGYGNSTTFWYDEAIEAYLKHQDVNVVPVYYYLTKCSAYDIAVNVPGLIAEAIATLIEELYERLTIHLNTVHLIGFSLGAHIAGETGELIQNYTGTQIGRITGLDPSGSFWYLRKVTNRLSRDDASFVDIIHTDGGGLGFQWPLGHADFYPNGGQTLQNGCSMFSIDCSHDRAAVYFVESISSDNFIGKDCETYVFFLLRWCTSENTAIMGENVNRNSSGTFFFTTNKRYPYARGVAGL